jgi:HSP20 family protein
LPVFAGSALDDSARLAADVVEQVAAVAQAARHVNPYVRREPAPAWLWPALPATPLRQRNGVGQEDRGMKPATALASEKGLRRLPAIDPLGRLFERLGMLPVGFEETLPLTTWTPLCDIYETEKEIVVKLEISGIKKEDVKVSLENNLLTIHGERKFEEEVKKETFHRVERNYGEFLRNFTLPATVDTTKILAEFKDGLLTVMLPKREEAKPKMIEVKVK